MKLRPRELGDWAPDRPASGGDGLRTAKNVVPYRHHYAPLKDLVGIGDALNSRPLGAVAVRDAAAAVHIYAGTADKLYEQNTDGTWTDRSRVGGYNATEATRWRFWTFGDRLFATNGQDEIQYLDMTAGSAFADLPGSPPIAQHGASFGNFVFLGNVEDSAMKVRWCSSGDSEAWVGGVSQAGEEVFPDGGQITGFAVLDSLYIFQESCIRRAYYVGPPAVFAFDKIEKERGCIAAGGLAQLGRMIFFPAEDGFYVFDGENAAPIGVDQEGASRYDEWFADMAQRDFFYRMSAAIDPRTKTVRWAFASTSSTTGQPDTMLTYNWAAGRAAYASVALELLAPMLTPSLTLEDLDDLYASIDDIPFSLDDPILAGGVAQLGAMTTDYEFGRFAGDNLEATFVTDDFIDIDGMAVFEMQAVMPMVDGDCRVKIGYRFKHNDTVSWSSETEVNSIGVAPCRTQGRFLRTQLRIPAGTAWTKIEGFSYAGVKRGET